MEENKRMIEESNQKMDEYNDELMELPKKIDDANLEVFFLTPIILYIIKEIISKTLYDEKNK